MDGINSRLGEVLLKRSKRQNPPYLVDVDNQNSNDPFKKIKEGGGSGGGSNVLTIVGICVGVFIGLIVVYVIVRTILNRKKENKGGFSQSHGMPKTQLTREQASKTMNTIMSAAKEVPPSSRQHAGHVQRHENRSADENSDKLRGSEKDSSRDDSGVENDVFEPPQQHQHDNHRHDTSERKKNAHASHHGSKRGHGASRREIDTLEKVKNEQFYDQNGSGDKHQRRSKRSDKRKMHYSQFLPKQMSNMNTSVKEFFTPHHNKSSRLPAYDEVVEERECARNSYMPRRRGDGGEDDRKYSQKNENGRSRDNEKRQRRRRTIAEDGIGGTGGGRCVSVVKNQRHSMQPKYKHEMDQFAMQARRQRSQRASQAKEEQVNAISLQRDFVPSSRK